jgi:hypothetical protein
MAGVAVEVPLASLTLLPPLLGCEVLLDCGGGGRADGGVFIINWKLSSVAGSFEM